MTSSRLLAEAKSALAALRKTDLPPHEWRAVTEIVRRIQRAIHVGGDAALNEALSDLQLAMPSLGNAEPSSRGGPRGVPTLGRSRGGIPTLDRPRGGIPRDSTGVAGQQEKAPDDLAAAIDQAVAAVEMATAEIVRIPHLDVDTELPVEPGQSFTVAVYLDKTPSRAGENAEPFELRDPPADEEIAVDVWLTSTSHFSIDGSATDVIVLRRDEDTSTRASFTITVRDPVPADTGPPALRARFDFRLRASGSVRRDIPIMAGNNVIANSEPEPAAPDRLVLQAHVSPPDLAISIAPLRG